MTEPASTYTTQILPASVVLAVPYTCQHCGAHLGQLIRAHGRTCLEQGLGPIDTISAWCHVCETRYRYVSGDQSLADLLAKREQAAELARQLENGLVEMVETKYREEKKG
jgi:RNase P subunit RPR2